ncbi:MAG: metallophosphoesterase [Epulopiscium sp.]|jgi:predicted MPP superfamily phosphohydrolase|nr:metallophosphoesterase [Candidatus Epulonipiscium sp.]
MKKYVRFFIQLLSLGAAFLYWQDNSIVTTRMQASFPNLPRNFHGYRILQISDLQNKSFGYQQKRLLKKIKKIDADLICITGDLLDANRTNVEDAMSLIQGIVPLAPVYYVSGNHEFRSGMYEELLLQLQMAGVHILENDTAKLELQGDTIRLMGLADIRANKNYSFVLQKLKKKCGNHFTILLSHRPELFSLYVKQNIDLIFTGHAHGGQIRLPFIGGLFAPNQGFLPKYTSGIHSEGRTNMVVSRGLGNSRFPFRIGNRPELVEVVLNRE